MAIKLTRRQVLAGAALAAAAGAVEAAGQSRSSLARSYRKRADLSMTHRLTTRCGTRDHS